MSRTSRRLLLVSRSKTFILRHFRLTLALGLGILCLVACFGLGASAQETGANGDPEAAFEMKADRLLKMVRHAAERDHVAAEKGSVREAASEVARLARVAGVRRSPGGSTSVGLTVQLTEASDAELRAAGFSVGARVGHIATVETDVARLPELAALASVRRMTAATYAHPMNDRARQSIGVDNATGQRAVAQTGQGVIVGVIDTGIDFHHFDFTVPGSGGKRTRIKALLDMTTTGTQSPDPNWNYSLPGQSTPIGHLYTEADINAALGGSGNVTEKDRNGHGTHVTGTAAGNGQASSTPGVYAGMAPEADLVIVKASRESDGTDDFRTDDMINALEFIQQKAAELGEPFVINMSLGGQSGPHDGTGADEETIDQIVNGGAGRAVCVAAGNEGGQDIHASGNVAPGGELDLQLNAEDPLSSGNPIVSPQFLDLFYSGADQISVTVVRPDGVQIGPVSYNNSNTSDTYVQVYNVFSPQDSQHNISLSFDDSAKNLKDAGSTTKATWTIKLRGDSITSGGHFDAWVGQGQFGNYVDPAKRVGSPGTSRGAITVGAYVTRSARYSIGDMAPFTSPGPTADGRQKPDVSAPGYYLYSSKSADVTSQNFGTIGAGDNAPVDSVHYTGLAGTSMATPVTTGAVALLLQVNPKVTISQIKSYITNTANHDNFDPVGWNQYFGQGKLNIAAALSSAGGTQQHPNPIDDPTFFVTQHYQDFLNRQPDTAGLTFWTSNITNCGPDSSCIAAKRVDTSAAYFLSVEFQQTGYLVHRFYRAAFGQAPAFAEFLPDTQTVGQGVVVTANDANGWQELLEANKQAYASAFITRAAFVQKYGSLTDAQYVSALIANTGATVDQTALVQGLGAGTETRATVLRKVAEDQGFYNSEFNRAFVEMQYFGYLRRDPDAAGFQFWLNKLNSFNGDYKAAQMVQAFITSTEYRQRFGQP